MIATPRSVLDTVLSIDEQHFLGKDMCLLAPLHTQLAGYVRLYHMSWNTAKQI